MAAQNDTLVARITGAIVTSAENSASNPPVRRVENGFGQGKYPYWNRLSRRAYEAQKAALQVEILKVQKWVEKTSEKVVILFEGRDVAGKGGTIKRFMEHMNPRTARVVAPPKPAERERGQWYFQRYIEHLPGWVKL